VRPLATAARRAHILKTRNTMKILDINGLNRLWEKIKERFDKVDNRLVRLHDEHSDILTRLDGKEDKTDGATRVLRFKGTVQASKIAGRLYEPSFAVAVGDVLHDNTTMGRQYFVRVTGLSADGSAVTAVSTDLPDYQTDKSPLPGVIFYSEQRNAYLQRFGGDRLEVVNYPEFESRISGLQNGWWPTVKAAAQAETKAELRPTMKTPKTAVLLQSMMPGSKVTLSDGVTYTILGYQVAAVQDSPYALKTTTSTSTYPPDLLAILYNPAAAPQQAISLHTVSSTAGINSTPLNASSGSVSLVYLK